MVDVGEMGNEEQKQWRSTIQELSFSARMEKSMPHLHDQVAWSDQTCPVLAATHMLSLRPWWGGWAAHTMWA